MFKKDPSKQQATCQIVHARSAVRSMVDSKGLAGPQVQLYPRREWPLPSGSSILSGWEPQGCSTVEGFVKAEGGPRGREMKHDETRHGRAWQTLGLDMRIFARTR